ncbi:MAG: leucine-rich repeat protein, partial [Clostridia bacterium]|nr:leucine-rich repeat protein [Clostridia bacterium]
ENITFSKSLIDYGDFSIDFCKSSPWYANLSDGEVYINNRLFGYKGTMPENTKIKVKEGTISIGNEAFKNYTNLTGIMLPDTLKSIGVNVFSGCTGLTSIVIPKNLTEIYSLPENLASIAVAQDNPKYDSRNNCNAIIEKQTNTLIFGCKNTVIPNDVTSIGDSAFSGCEITEITLPNGLVNIGYMAFAYSSLTSITIPSSVTTIGISAFAGSDLTTAKFDNPSNWIRANSATATTGTAVTVTSDFTEANATELKKDDGTYLLRKTA